MPWYLDDFEYRTIKKLFLSVAIIFFLMFAQAFVQSVSVYRNLTGSVTLSCRLIGVIINFAAIAMYFGIKKKQDLLLPAGVGLVLADFILSRTATILQVSDPGLSAIMTLFYPPFALVLGLFVRKLWPVVILELSIVSHFFAVFFFFPEKINAQEAMTSQYTRTVIVTVAVCLVLSIVIIHLTIAIHSILYENLKKKQKFLENLAYHDQETGIPNAMELERIGASHIASLATGKELYLLAAVNLARLEELRERVGHANTVSWIIRFINELTAELQLRSSSKTGFHSRIPVQAYRIDPETIAIPLIVPIENAPATDITTSLAHAVETVLLETNSESLVDFYGALVACPIDTDSVPGMIQNVYNILHHNAAEGRSRFTPFNTNEYTKYLRKEQLLEQMQSASFEREIRAVFQPKIEIATGICIGFEALARWKNPILGVVPPSEFIPLAERTKMIRTVTDRIIEDTRQFVGKIRQANRTARVSFNLSPALFTKQNLVDFFGHIESQEIGNWLEIEITEGILLKLTPETAEEIARLKKLGVHFSIDDFGTGYSNISSLQSFEADVLKIDKCFIDGIPGDEKSTSLVRTILLLGQSLSMTTIAEGVETAEQRDFLADLNCDQIQGYLFSKPLEADEALAYLTGL